MNGDIWRFVYRYRPYAILLAAVLAVVVVPSRTIRTAASSGAGTSASQAVDAGAGRSAGAPGATAGGSGVPDGVGAPGSLASGGAGPNAGTSGSTSGQQTGGGSGGSAGPGGGVGPTDAGIGTAAALHGPMCDPVSGRIKFPVYFREPCVRPWPKGTPNGGATAPGVSADTITVAIVAGGTSIDTDSNRAEVQRAWRDLFAVWAGTHESYGRAYNLVFNDFGGSGQAPDEAQQRAMAIQVASEKPFAALVMSVGNVLPQELARRGILTVVSTAVGNWRDYNAFPGLLWGAQGATEVSECLTAQYAKKLVGKPARWAGEADFQVKTRKFALMYPNTGDSSIISACLTQAGYRPDLTITYDADPTTFQQEAPTFISKLKADGITTILGGAGEFFNLAVLTKQATSQRYFPEWVINGQASDDLDFIVRGFADQIQARHFFGFGFIPPGTTSTNEWFTHVLDWYYGANKPSWRGDAIGTGPNSLVMMNLLRTVVTGVHMAGPNLTVKTFQAGRFAVPGYGGLACSCLTTEQEQYGPGILPSVLGGDSYVPTSDMTEFWWDGSSVGPDGVGVTNGPGMWRYEYGGRREKIGAFPPGEPPAFSTANTITNNDTQSLPGPDRAAAGPAYRCQTHDPHYSTTDAYKACPSG